MFGTEDSSQRAFNCFKQLGDTLNALWLLRGAGTDSSIPSKAADILDSLRSGEDMSFLRNRFAFYGETLTDITIVTVDEYLNYLFSSPDFRAFVENNISTLAEMYREQSKGKDFPYVVLEDFFNDNDDNGFVNFGDEDYDTGTSDTVEEDDEDDEWDTYFTDTGEEDDDVDWDTDIIDTSEDFEDLDTDTSDTVKKDDEDDEEDDEDDEEDDEEDEYEYEEEWNDFSLK